MLIIATIVSVITIALAGSTVRFLSSHTKTGAEDKGFQDGVSGNVRKDRFFLRKIHEAYDLGYTQGFEFRLSTERAKMERQNRMRHQAYVAELLGR